MLVIGKRSDPDMPLWNNAVQSGAHVGTKAKRLFSADSGGSNSRESANDTAVFITYC